MADLQTLRGRVEDYLIDVPSATSSLVDDWIRKALDRIQRNHNFRVMEATVEFITSQNTRKLGDIPSDWKEARSAPWLHTGLGDADLIDWAVSGEQMRALFAHTDTVDAGAPAYVLETETELEVYPFPDDQSLWTDGNYRVEIPYWKKLTEPTANGDTNWFMENENGEWVVTFWAVEEGMWFNREEERAKIFGERGVQEFRELQRHDKRTRIPRRMTLAPAPGVYSTRRGRHWRGGRR